VYITIKRMNEDPLLNVKIKLVLDVVLIKTYTLSCCNYTCLLHIMHKTCLSIKLINVL